MLMTSTAQTEADRQLKAKHRAIWASGDYARVADEVVWDLGARLVNAVEVHPGDRVLDVATGTGSAAIRAAARGATVVASDLTPELFEAGRRRATQAGVQLDWREADAEALPFNDGEFDVTMSCIGLMFAPFHERGAAEMLRVTRPAGTIGLISWTPKGFIGQMFATMKPFAPPLPAGAQPAPRWGAEEHVRGLFGDGVRDVSAVTESLTVDCFETPESFRDFFKAYYGPTIAVYKRIADDPEQVRALDEALVELARRFGLVSAGDSVEWEYLRVTARRG